VVDSAWAEASLDDLEASSWTENHKVIGNADVFKRNVTVTMGSIIEAKD